MNKMRIYLSGRGLGHYRPLLDGLKKQVERGALPFRENRNRNQFVFLDDLLSLKGEIVGTNIHNGMSVDLYTLLQDGVIAFGAVKKIALEILDDVKRGNLTLDRGYVESLDRSLPNVGYVYRYNRQMIAPYLIRHGLADWIALP